MKFIVSAKDRNTHECKRVSLKDISKQAEMRQFSEFYRKKKGRVISIAKIKFKEVYKSLSMGFTVMKVTLFNTGNSYTH